MKVTIHLEIKQGICIMPPKPHDMCKIAKAFKIAWPEYEVSFTAEIINHFTPSIGGE